MALEEQLDHVTHALVDDDLRTDQQRYYNQEANVNFDIRQEGHRRTSA